MNKLTIISLTLIGCESELSTAYYTTCIETNIVLMSCGPAYNMHMYHTDCELNDNMKRLKNRENAESELDAMDCYADSGCAGIQFCEQNYEDIADEGCFAVSSRHEWRSEAGELPQCTQQEVEIGFR